MDNNRSTAAAGMAGSRGVLIPLLAAAVIGMIVPLLIPLPAAVSAGAAAVLAGISIGIASARSRV